MDRKKHLKTSSSALFFCDGGLTILKYIKVMSVPCCRLGTGWSVHTNKFATFNRQDQLSLDEQEQIMGVIKRAEQLEKGEMERIG